MDYSPSKSDKKGLPQLVSLFYFKKTISLDPDYQLLEKKIKNNRFELLQDSKFVLDLHSHYRNNARSYERLRK